MGFELYILNQLCDPPKESEVVASYATNLIGEVKTRQGIYSNTIVLPDTNRNRTIFENAQLLLSATDIPYNRLDAVIKVDGATLVVGFANLLSTKGNFTLFVIGGNGDWFDLIGSSKLNDMDLVELHHKWTDANVFANRANIWSDGFLYPNADYGGVTSQVSTNVTFDQLYLGIYAKYLVQEIFGDLANYTIAGDWWDNDTLIAKQLIPFCNLWKRDTRYEYRRSFSAVFNNQTTPTIYPGAVVAFPIHTGGNTTTTADSYYDFLPVVSFTYDTAVVIPSAAHWLVLDSGAMTFNYDFSVWAGAATYTITLIYVDTNGNQQNVTLVNGVGATIGVSYPHSGTITLDIQRGGIFLSGINCAIDAGSTLDFDIEAFAEDASELFIDTTYSWITPGSTLPEVSNMDFLRTIWNQYGIIFTSDPLTGYVNVFTLAEVQANILNADDWSNRLDLSEKPELKYKMDGYGQTNIFKYQTDTIDQYLLPEPDYGMGTLTVADQNLDIEVILFESVFAPIKRISSFDGAKTMGYIPKWIDSEEQSVVPRMCYVEFDAYNNITIGVHGVEATQPNLYFTELEFTNLLATYYTTLSSILADVKIVNCLMRLSRADIAGLDFRKPKYIAYFAAYFWLNEIKQYKFTSYESTMVELVRI